MPLAVDVSFKFQVGKFQVGKFRAVGV